MDRRDDGNSSIRNFANAPKTDNFFEQYQPTFEVIKILFFFSVAGMASLRQQIPASAFNKHDLWNDSILFRLFIITVTPLRNNTR